MKLNDDDIRRDKHNFLAQSLLIETSYLVGGRRGGGGCGGGGGGQQRCSVITACWLKMLMENSIFFSQRLGTWGFWGNKSLKCVYVVAPTEGTS